MMAKKLKRQNTFDEQASRLLLPTSECGIQIKQK